jgi:glucosamine--fructose-6-phosphate aminotransferase (isomerizing)
MCGIVGFVSGQDVSHRLIEGLRRLEYRGYDSAGIAVLAEGAVDRRRAVGKLSNLEARLSEEPISGSTGIGHTRWATHGRPTEDNAHPHGSREVAVVHNGIIENFRDLRTELTDDGAVFESETDTEVIAKLLEAALRRGEAPEQAFRSTLERLEGAFALGVIFASEEDRLYCARRGSPLVVGFGTEEMMIGSDAIALAPFTRRIAYLEEGDSAVLSRSGVTVYDGKGQKADRQAVLSDASAALVGKGQHRHFMGKEIAEQPEIISHAIAHYVRPAEEDVLLPGDGIDFASVDRLVISGCGTAYLAGLIARYWFESWAGLPVEIDIASELRYRQVPYGKNAAALFISQSGETADTLAAMRHAKEAGVRTGAVVNVPESSMAREADGIYPIKAGPEIGVASTKAFTCQLATLGCIAIAAGRARGVLSREDERRLVAGLLSVPRLMTDVLGHHETIEALSHHLQPARDVLYVGRGVSFPLALEGALKLKEISYIHAEGYAAGELKHGPIALIDEDVPVVVIAPPDRHFDKTISNMHEVIARGAKCLLLSSEEGLRRAGHVEELLGSLALPEVEDDLSPLIYALPIQLLAYHTAVLKGTDVDQPRNLAKSVTVE